MGGCSIGIRVASHTADWRRHKGRAAGNHRGLGGRTAGRGVDRDDVNSAVDDNWARGARNGVVVCHG